MKEPNAIQPVVCSVRTASLRFTFYWAVVNVTLTSVSAPPNIEFQPKDQTVILYQQAAFGVIASGTAPLSYQWRLDGATIHGATNDQIVFAHSQFVDAAQYSVVVSNADGSVISTNAVLKVNSPKGGDLDSSFAVESPPPVVGKLVLQPNGKFLASLYDSRRSWLARINADGTTDHTFQSQLTGSPGMFAIQALAVQSDGKILAYTWRQNASNYFARLNVDGSFDGSFLQPEFGGTSFGLSVIACALQSDGKLLIGGTFSTVNGVYRNGIARLNADGTLDNSFQTRLSDIFGNPASVQTLIVQSDGKVIFSGSFTNVDFTRRDGIARLNPDGTLDMGFRPQLSVSPLPSPPHIPYVPWTTLQDDGKVLISGYFKRVDGVARTNFARLNPDGTLDTDFQPAFPRGNGFVWPVVSQADGKVLIFDQSAAGEEYVTRFRRLNPDGTVDLTFTNTISWEHRFENDQASVDSVALRPDGKVLVTGHFTHVNGVGQGRIAQLNPDGSLDTEFQPEYFRVRQSGPFLGRVGSFALQSDGKVLVGGRLLQVDLGTREPLEETTGIMRLGSEGSIDSNFFNGFSVNLGLGYGDGSIHSVLWNDGKTIVGGGFTSIGGVGRTNIASLDEDGIINDHFLMAQPVAFETIVPEDGGTLIGVNPVWSPDGSVREIVRLHPDGTMHTLFPLQAHPSFRGLDSSCILALVPLTDGKLLVGGRFATINGVARLHIARLNPDGTVDSEFQSVSFDEVLPPDVIPGHRSAVNSIGVQADGKVVIGGQFRTVNRTPHSGIVRLNVDGTLDLSFANGLSGVAHTNHPVVSSVVIQPDRKILIGGAFSTVNGVPRIGIARLESDGSLDITFTNILSGIEAIENPAVSQIALDAHGKVFITGNFAAVNGSPAWGIARLWGSADVPPAITGINHSGGVTLTWDALPNRIYRVQYKDGVSALSWTDLAGDISGSSAGVASKTDTTAGSASQRFYRVVLLP